MHPPSYGPMGTGVARRLFPASRSPDDAALLTALRGAMDRIPFGGALDDFLAEPVPAPALTDLLVAHPWASGPVDQSQWVVDYGHHPEPPILDLRPPVRGQWFMVPMAPITTRGPVLGAPCLAAICQEDPFYSAPWCVPPEETLVDDAGLFRAARFEPPDGPVLEIRSADDWVALVERFPYPHEGIVYPRWSAIAAEYVGVHLTLTAYLEAAWALLPTRDGTTTIRGIGPDVTVWLRAGALRGPALR